jgi:hypothetical protein
MLAHGLPGSGFMITARLIRRAAAIAVAATIVVLGACSGAGNILRGIGGGPAATEEQVVAMLNFDAYVNNNFIRRQKLLASCENLRTFYNQVERSIQSELPDSSRYVVAIVAAQRTNLQSVTASRSWPKKGKVEASYRIAKGHTDSVDVSLWRSQSARRPATWRVARKGPVGLKLDALGKKALTVTCTRSAAE